jgi:hypothetical protein
MKVADIIHFAYDKASKNFYPEMDSDYANNVVSYENLIYGLYWQEPGGGKWAGDFCKSGEIVIRDNDRPNLFVKMKDLKYDTDEYVAPGRLKSEAWGKWHNLFGNATNGPLKLSGDISGISKTFKYLALDPVKAEFYKTNENAGSRLEVDVPAFFSVLAFDNCSTIKINEFSISKQGAMTGSEEFFTTESDYKYLFREPGKYFITVKCEDNALGWPSDYTKPVDTAAKLTNDRELTVELDVLSTKLDVRIIERQREGN